ncbi:hypothetical protein [Brazilian marseillevirus]|uniref:hypothetical protein n=1 Tax=Brazilian marseillevirus TaxID=1813599 RepID=UPI00078348FC|nr:hypothetical protein A3303_gp153 [Brazilian marseillevirus]AMQ10661.1 hypothetical protein [Brazilian marseillevirus]
MSLQLLKSSERNTWFFLRRAQRRCGRKNWIISNAGTKRISKYFIKYFFEMEKFYQRFIDFLSDIYPEIEPLKDNQEEEKKYGAINGTWIGKLVKNEEGVVYRVTLVGQSVNYLERQRLLVDPVRWIPDVYFRTETFGKSTKWGLLGGYEIVFPRDEKNTPKTSSDPSRLSERHIGKFVQKKQRVYKVLSYCPEISSWRLVEMKRGKEGQVLRVHEQSTDWNFY